ncbi:hypothetical protein [Streptomyces sp. NPDC001068]|uniref:hypothetical protein n=1 Tax=Streptomyces sp. NPDC001068 TaxID=3364544 RepID=UPI0036A50B0C
MTSPHPTSRTVHALDRHGFVRDWLISPAWRSGCDDLAHVLSATGSPWGDDGRWVLTNGPDAAPLKRRLYRLHPLLTDQPLPGLAEGAAFDWTRSAGDAPSSARWRREHTGEDGLLDWSEFCFTPEYRHALAGAVLEVDQGEYRDLEVGCTGPFVLFVDGRPVLTGTEFAYMEPRPRHVRVRLRSGVTTVHLATWQVAFREVRHVARLRVGGLPVRVVLPSPGADEYRARAAEQLLESLAVGPWACADGRTGISGPAGGRLLVSVDGRPAEPVVLPDRGTAPVALAGRAPETENTASMLATGENVLRITADDPRSPVFRTARVATLPPRRRAEPVGDRTAWRAELLDHAGRAVPGAARALARHALAPDAPLDPADLDGPLTMLADRADCADFEAVGLVHLWHRIPRPHWPPGRREAVREALTGFKYWIDQPGLDAMCYFTENHQFVWHTAELLAGELLPDEEFTNTGWPGHRHAAHAGPLAEEWMRRKLTGGFSEFDSNAYLAIDTLALVSLVEFASSDPLRRLAEALLDKVLLTLACNSWRGVHGAAHGRSYTPTLRSSRFEETAPVMWLLWGVGSLNGAVLPATALATAEHYRVPPVIPAIAADLPDEWDGRQVYRGHYRLHHDLLSRPYDSDLRVWRTPDAMLSSVQDYRAGLPGLQEHVWGATLGSEVQVFATHPAAATIGSSARPNAWAGQRVLPRARQHRDTVVVLHRLPEAAEATEATHLWFPADLCDEWREQGCWLAGRVGDGYAAVATAGGFRPDTTGDEARQAWTPFGDGRAFVATVGRRATDGSFADFTRSLAAPGFGRDRHGDPEVSWTARDGRRLHLSWSGAFTVDGALPDPDPAPPHLDSPACRQEFGARELRAALRDAELVLDLDTGRRVTPASGIPPTGQDGDSRGRAAPVGRDDDEDPAPPSAGGATDRRSGH